MKFINYCKECYDELVHRVTWPSMKELTGSATVVMTASFVIAVIVWLMDLLFKQVMTMVYPG